MARLLISQLRQFISQVRNRSMEDTLKDASVQSRTSGPTNPFNHTKVPMSDIRNSTNEHVNKVAGNTAQAVRTNGNGTDQQPGRHAADKAAEVARTATRESAAVAQQAAKAVQDTVRTGTEVANRMAERSSERFNEALNRSDRHADEVAKASEHVVRASAETARRGAETAHQAAQSGLTMVSEVAQRSVDQFTRTFGFSGDNADEVARKSSRNIQSVTDSGAVLARGLQDISREWVTFAQGRLRQNLEGMSRLAGCRSLQDVVQVQSDLARTGLEESINSARTIAQLSLRVADEAGQKIKTQAGSHSVEIDDRRQGQTHNVA